MNLQPSLRPDLAAACLFATKPKHREPNSAPSNTGVLAELASHRL